MDYLFIRKKVFKNKLDLLRKNIFRVLSMFVSPMRLSWTLKSGARVTSALYSRRKRRFDGGHRQAVLQGTIPGTQMRSGY